MRWKALVGLWMFLWLAAACSIPRPAPPPPRSTATLPQMALRTATPLPTATPEPRVRFAVVGDFGTGEEPAREVAAMIRSWEPDFVLTTGDNNYPDGSAATIDENIGELYGTFFEEDEAGRPRFLPSLGNHDWRTAGAQPFLDYFELPGNERYYEVRWEPVHIFVLDSDRDEPDGVTPDSVQAAWLREQLAASDSPWQIVAMHHPPYSSGYHGSIEYMQWPFVAWGVDLVLSGHEHSYERFEVEGIPFVVNGLGGQDRYEFEESVPGSQLRFNEEFGAMLVEATPRLLTFQFITLAGEVVDDVTLAAD